MRSGHFWTVILNKRKLYVAMLENKWETKGSGELEGKGGGVRIKVVAIHDKLYVVDEVKWKL